MDNSAVIQYSSLALYQVRNLLAEVDPGEGSIELGNIQEEASRPDKLFRD